MSARTSAAPARARVVTVVLWTAQIALAVFFIAASGAPKLLGAAQAVDSFTQIGVGQWFRYLVGALEVAGGVGLLVPRLAGLAAYGLALLTVGAAITQAFVLGEPSLAVFPLVLAVIFAVIGWLRSHRTADLVRWLRR